jgi:hypothetical protein
LSHKGGLDSLVPVELAYPDSLFFQRLLNHEALYYGREARPDRRRQLIYIVTQTGLEMKGDHGQVARGLSLALGKVMALKGYEVRHSFIGSRWLEPVDLGRTEALRRLLYYRDPGWLQAGEMLAAVARQLQGWREEFQGITVFWVVSEFWGVDESETFQARCRQLQGQADRHQAWMITLPGSRGGSSPLFGSGRSDFFHHCQVVDGCLPLAAAGG